MQWKWIRLGTVRLWVRSLALFSGLKIWHCYEPLLKPFESPKAFALKQWFLEFPGGLVIRVSAFTAAVLHNLNVAWQTCLYDPHVSACYIGFQIFFFFLFYSHTYSIWKFLDQGLNGSCSWGLHHSCSWGSGQHWIFNPGIEPEFSRILCWFLKQLSHNGNSRILAL